LEEAEQLLRAAVDGYPATVIEDPELAEPIERLRWFPLPGEVLAELTSTARPLHADVPLHLRA
jgi:hypothetical protein